jgi:hypothetical protein
MDTTGGGAAALVALREWSLLAIEGTQRSCSDDIDPDNAEDAVAMRD